MNKIQKILVDNKIIDEDSIEQIYDKVRDRDDVAVLKCNKSGVIFLSTDSHMDLVHYENKEEHYRSFNLKRTTEDNTRRYDTLYSQFINKKWLDIGTGAGGILDLIKPITAETWSVEPQNKARTELVADGHTCLPTIADCQDNFFEVVSLFHVVEHFNTPIETLSEIKTKMVKGGTIIIEIPHASDFLLSFLSLDAFKKFTFWSEHLILHTRQSITQILEIAGFKNIIVQGIQRYPLANHMHWLSQNSPGGHISWNFLRTQELDSEYEKVLVKIDKTDTLLVFANA